MKLINSLWGNMKEYYTNTNKEKIFLIQTRRYNIAFELGPKGLLDHHRMRTVR